jgi:hypothetical protein
MRTVAAAVVALAVSLVSGCLVSPVIPFGGGVSSEKAQRVGIERQVPALLTARETWKGPTRIARVRVWADDEYRAQNVRWQHGFEEQLVYANLVLTPMLGIRLEAEYHAWQRHAPDAPLSEHLAALVRQDAGDDAVFVVGLTSALGLVAEPFEKIGVAGVGGPHLMMRGHADVEERKAFDHAFPDMDRELRDAVLEARRRHKTAALLIHEIAHSLGALHEVAVDSIMFATYSHHAASIGARNRELMLITLADRLRPPRERDPASVGRRSLIVLEPEGVAWVPAERERRIAELREQGVASPNTPRPLDGGKPVVATNAAARDPGRESRSPLDTPPGTPRTSPSAVDGAVVDRPVVVSLLPPSALESYRRVRDRLRLALDADGAARELAPLLSAYPQAAQLHLLACEIEIHRGDVKAPSAVAACDRAAAVTTDPGPALEVAGYRRFAGDPAGARAALAGAEARLAALPPGAAAGGWLRLARHYHEEEAVTWAETAAAHAGDSDAARDITGWAAMTRIRYGIPRDRARYKLVPDDDAAALAAVRDVLAKVNRGDFAAANRAAAAAEKRWPGLPGVLAARCDLELRRDAIAAARGLCAKAIAGGSSWATYLAGAIELQVGNHAAAVARLRAAIALDPTLSQAWSTLAKIFRRRNAIADLDQLHRDYRAQFGSELPL